MHAKFVKDSKFFFYDQTFEEEREKEMIAFINIVAFPF